MNDRDNYCFIFHAVARGNGNVLLSYFMQLYLFFFEWTLRRLIFICLKPQRQNYFKLTQNVNKTETIWHIKSLIINKRCCLHLNLIHLAGILDYLILEITWLTFHIFSRKTGQSWNLLQLICELLYKYKMSRRIINGHTRKCNFKAKWK